MATPLYHDQIKQVYLSEIRALGVLCLSNKAMGLHGDTSQQAVKLVGNLLDDFGNIGTIASEFHEEFLDSDRDIILDAFIHSISFEHGRFDEFLAEIHMDSLNHYPCQLLTWETPGLDPRQHSTTLEQDSLHRQYKPKLWGRDGQALHNADAFYTVLGKQANIQLLEILDHKDFAYGRIASSLPRLSVPTRIAIVDASVRYFATYAIQKNDPRRKAIVSFMDPGAEVIERLRVYHRWNFNGGLGSKRRAFEKGIFDTLAEVQPDRRGDVFKELSSFLVSMTEQDSAESYFGGVSDNNLVGLMTDYLTKAQLHGFDVVKQLAECLRVEFISYAQMIAAAAEKLPSRPYSSFAGQPDSSVVYAALLMTQDDQRLLDSNLGADAILSLFLLKGDDRYKRALENSDRADHLLAHDLGL